MRRGARRMGSEEGDRDQRSLPGIATGHLRDLAPAPRMSDPTRGWHDGMPTLWTHESDRKGMHVKKTKRARARSRASLTLAVAAMATMGVALGSAGAAGAAGDKASAPGITASQVTIGLDTSLTGPAAANFNGAQQGAQARIDLQNAEGGVNGRKIKLVVADDQSSPTEAQTAVSSLIQTQNAFGLLFVSDLVSAAYRLPQQLGVPVVGAAIDGPEWGEQPNTNMVSVAGDQGKVLPTYTDLAKAAKLAGAKNMASLAIADEQPSIIGAENYVKAAHAVGLKVGYENYSIPLGSVNSTTVVLAMKKAQVDGFQSYMLNTTDFAIMEGAKQAGLTLKAPMDFTSYTQDLLDNPSALQAAQGLIVAVAQVPVEEHTAATEKEQAAFKKYEHFTGVPNLNWTYGWLSADLFIKGLQSAGKNPTRASVLDALHHTTGWTANGLLGKAPDLSLKDFGHAPKTACSYFVRLVGSAYVPMNNGKQVCGNLVG